MTSSPLDLDAQQSPHSPNPILSLRCTNHHDAAKAATASGEPKHAKKEGEERRRPAVHCILLHVAAQGERQAQARGERDQHFGLGRWYRGGRARGSEQAQWEWCKGDSIGKDGRHCRERRGHGAPVGASVGRSRCSCRRPRRGRATPHEWQSTSVATRVHNCQSRSPSVRPAREQVGCTPTTLIEARLEPLPTATQRRSRPIAHGRPRSYRAGPDHRL